MYLITRAIIFSLFLFSGLFAFSQEKTSALNFNELEIGVAAANAEAFYFGIYGKYSIPLTQKKHHFRTGVSLTTYADFKGESTDQAYLNNDVDMRLIPAVYIGYNFRFRRLGFALEIPFGTSIAITKGILVNERIGFERKYSNTEILWHYGIALTMNFKLNGGNKLDIHGFMPLVKDIAWSSPLIGVGWIKSIH